MKPITRFFFTLLFGISLSILAILLARGQTVVAAPQVTIRYVATTGSDTTDCTYSATPCATIQYAVDQAGAGDEVRVAGGEYTDVHARVEHDPFLPNQTLFQTVFISQPLTVRGGYTLTNWTTSNLVSNPTTINPQGEGRGVVVMTTQGVTLENFRVVGGDASVDGYLASAGGGIGVFYAEAVVQGNVVVGNIGYGGLGMDSSTVLVHGNVITGHINTGVYGKYSTLTLTQNAVTSNAGNFGAGLHVEHSMVVLIENQIKENTASQQGGGVWLAYSPSTTVMSNTIANNTSSDNGGGMAVGVTAGQDVFIGNTFSGNSNTSGFGGGISILGNEVIFQRNVVWNNQAALLGGGVYVSASYAELADNSLQENVAGEGGGMWVEGAHITVLGNNVLSNTATTYGGGIYGEGTLTITQNTLEGNTAQNGGGVYIQQNSEVMLAENTITRNSAQDGGGISITYGPYAQIIANTVTSNTASSSGGGGLLLSTGQMTVDGNSFVGNSVLGPGSQGGGVFLGGNEVAFNNNLVKNNSANWQGGGIYLNGETFTLHKNEIRGNYSDWDGGGMTILAAQAFMEGNSFVQNSARAIGGGMTLLMLNGQGVTLTNNLIADNQIVETGFLWDGSGIYLQSDEATLYHNTLAHNYGGEGSGLLIDNSGAVTMVDNMIVSHTLGVRVVNGATVNTEATLWDNDTNWTIGSGGIITTGTINLYGDPHFVDPAHGDYHLSPDSLAIDAGVDAGIPTDIDGDPRPYGLGFDIGADEQPAVVRYVATTGSDTTDCTNSANPCATIQYAVDQAGAGDEVRVAGGEYTDLHTRPRHDTQNTDFVEQIVYLTKTVTIRGGYTLANWTFSDPVANPTTLDAQSQGRGVYITGAIAPTLQGLRIVRGSADGQGGHYIFDAGGGIYSHLANLTLLESQLISNTVSTSVSMGGAVYSYQGHANFTGNIFKFNTATSGGALNTLYTDVTFIENQVISNTSEATSGVIISLGTTDILSNTFTGNQTTNHLDATLSLSESSANIQYNIFANNDAAGLYIAGIVNGTNTVNLHHNEFFHNVTQNYGGAISASYLEALTMTQNLVISNTATGGGGVYLLGVNVYMEANQIANNHAGWVAGGVYINSDTAIYSQNDLIVNNSLQPHGYGNGIFINSAESLPIQMFHPTIANNYGGDETGILFLSGSLTMTNAILSGHDTGISVFPDWGSVHFEATLWNNTTNISGTGSITTGTINLYGNPAFLDPANGDYHLSPDSIAIDAGVDAGIATDLDGDIRPQGAGFDLGADEFVGVFAPSGIVHLQGRDDASGAVVSAWSGGTIVATTTTDSAGAYLLTLPDGTYTLTVEMPLYLDARKTNVTISNSSLFSLAPVTLKGGDVNESDTINILDLAVIGAHYNLTCGDPDWDPRADINGDCEVNLLDLVLAAGNFGKSSPVGWS